MSACTHPVLLVEDDDDIRETLGELLEDAGFSVVLASSGGAALDHLRIAPVLPAVILLDLRMPVMDGWQFRAEQWENPAWRSIPIVAISATERSAFSAAALGAHACMTKPLDLQELTCVLQEIYAGAARAGSSG